MDMRQRINFYTDGFNFYHRIRNFLAETRVDYRWLDYRALCESLLKPHETLGEVFFFTAIPHHLERATIKRHQTLLRALKSRGVQVVEGKFQDRKEKMTDVAIASQMLVDAYEDWFDTCFLISNDSDFVPAVRAVRRRANKRIGLIVPPSVRPPSRATELEIFGFERARPAARTAVSQRRGYHKAGWLRPVP